MAALQNVCGTLFCMQRCRGSRALAYFADPKKNEDYDEEEAHHLLGNVIDSDDEQAQAGCLRT